jgi:hypothetical protein
LLLNATGFLSYNVNALMFNISIPVTLYQHRNDDSE